MEQELNKKDMRPKCKGQECPDSAIRAGVCDCANQAWPTARMDVYPAPRPIHPDDMDISEN